MALGNNKVTPSHLDGWELGYSSFNPVGRPRPTNPVSKRQQRHLLDEQGCSCMGHHFYSSRHPVEGWGVALVIIQESSDFHSESSFVPQRGGVGEILILS